MLHIDSKKIVKIAEQIHKEMDQTYYNYKMKAWDYIEEYIIQHNLIIHGRLAIMELLKQKKINKHDSSLLPKIDEPNRYYKCFSLNGKKNIAEIITKLRELKYDNIRSQVTHLSYGVRCVISVGEFRQTLPVFEVIHISKYEYYRLNTSAEKIKKSRKAVALNKPLKVIHPLLAKISILNLLIDPLDGLNEVYSDNWETMYKYKILMDKYYNEYFWLKGRNQNIKSRKKSQNNILNDIFKILVEHDVIFIEDFVYNIYQYNKKINLTKYVVLARDIKSLINKLKKKLEQGSKKIIVKEFDNKVNFIESKYIISYNNEHLLDIYNITSNCVPYVNYKLKNKQVKIGNYFVVLKYYYAILWDNLVNYMNKKCSISYVLHLEGMIKNLISCRETYLKQNKSLGIMRRSQQDMKKNNIFSVFGINCEYSNEYYTDTRAHNVKLWEYKKTHSSEEYSMAKRMCEPLKEKKE